MTTSPRALQIAAFTTLLVGACTLSTSHALELASFKIVAQGGGAGEANAARITILDQLTSPGSPAPAYNLFDEITLTPSDEGTTFVLNAADLDFEVFEQMLTNAVNDNFGFTVSFLPEAGGMGSGWNELNFFAPGTQPFGPGSITSIGQSSGPDFAGYDIERVTLTIDKFALTNTGSNYSHDLQATARIIAVPEPSNRALLLAGAATLACRRRETKH